jgi:GTPase SAR1 family protein
MSTQLGTYCKQFDATLRPVLHDLAAAAAAIGAAAQTPAKSLHAPLLDLHHQLEALCDKVAEQQAYVLIFGPLKSGKSTLMNAIAAAYVSEVSSLPAYPCLVFVRPGDERTYTTTSYDGTEHTFAAGRELHEHIEKAHAELAQAIRSAEQGGVPFDPQEHFPVAIRSVEVRVPGTKLAADGAVLVDTPGLYTRMRFGYDRMTRDFRHSAACAIFVVKSDTLFLEQVFTEFEQLLDLFSRIFLVVNIDSHKRDLSPDGRLVPSLEQSQPEAVLRAFEQLAMSAPMQRAAAEGRVRMYPVDLMRAASSVLQQQPEQAPPGFRSFRQDLADYLASSDYLTAFLHDSLHRADSLLGEATGHATGAAMTRLEQQLAEVEDRLAFVTNERKRVGSALQLDWTQVCARTEQETTAEVERCARDAGAKLLRILGASIDTWFLSSQSLDWLVAQQWTPLVHDYREQVLAAAMRSFEQQQAQGTPASTCRVVCANFCAVPASIRRSSRPRRSHSSATSSGPAPPRFRSTSARSRSGGECSTCWRSARSIACASACSAPRASPTPRSPARTKPTDSGNRGASTCTSVSRGSAANSAHRPPQRC